MAPVGSCMGNVSPVECDGSAVRAVSNRNRSFMSPWQLGGQRGLLGVSTDPTRRIFVAYTGTGPGRPIEVAQVVPAFRLVWAGPESSALANGGHLVYDTRRQQLIIGIGHLGQRAKVSEPNSPNGKLLLLHPDGAPTQHPTVLSEG